MKERILQWLGKITAEKYTQSQELLDTVAAELVRLNKKYGIDIIFKASFDKANRTSLNAFRGPGMVKGLVMLQEIKDKYGLKLLTDIHESYQAEKVGKVVDVIQIPAFLCRQTDLLVAAAKTGKIVNIKKAQFLSGRDMKYPVEKCVDSGAKEVWLTERGNSFGYNNLVVDMRGLLEMRKLGYPVVFDATHSVQIPGGQGETSGGNSTYVYPLARAALAVGVDGIFAEVHPDPTVAKSDGPNMLKLIDVENILKKLLEYDKLTKEY